MDVWILITEDRFEEALEQADRQYEQTGDLSVLRNKLYALFQLERYEECIYLSKEIISLRNGETDSDFVFLGIAYWILGKELEAIGTWKEGENSKFTDGAGGIESQTLQYFASIKRSDKELQSQVLKKINKILKGKRSFNWPGAIGRYLSEGWDDEKLLSYVMGIPILKERQLCQAYFAIAIKRLEEGSISEYQRNLEISTSFGANAYLEKMYYLAKGELKNLAAKEA